MLTFTASDWRNLLSEPAGFVVTIAPPASPGELQGRKRVIKRPNKHPYGYAAKIARLYAAQSRYSRAQFAHMHDLTTEELAAAIRGKAGIERRQNRKVEGRYK